jgi:predicted transcriptional regulator
LFTKNRSDLELYYELLSNLKQSGPANIWVLGMRSSMNTSTKIFADRIKLLERQGFITMEHNQSIGNSHMARIVRITEKGDRLLRKLEELDKLLPMRVDKSRPEFEKLYYSTHSLNRR